VDWCAKTILVLGCALLMAATLAHAQTTNSSTPGAGNTTGQPKAQSSHKRASHRKSRRSSRKGQQKIDHERALQIQQALIREHYLSGKPTGVWDSTTQAAMQRYQGDNGWQSKTTPDSRALIKLGLGPDHEHLLNPESAMTSQPQSQTLPASSSVDPTHTQPQK
jgi:peptidoglycan hydrolase-like protein with peptidoglycan-binding domain